MAPKKSSAQAQRQPTTTTSSVRVTRAAAKRAAADAFSAPVAQLPEKKSKKPKAVETQNRKSKPTKGSQEKPKAVTATENAGDASKKTIVIEHCAVKSSFTQTNETHCLFTVCLFHLLSYFYMPEASGHNSNDFFYLLCLSKQCASFKTRANHVKEGLEKSVAGITVILNPEKPRKGCFEIREEGGEKFISLLDMKRPFTSMKKLDMEKVTSDIIDKITYNITRLLRQYPDLGLLNQYITEANLAEQINGRGTVTVLALDNGTLSSISGRSKDAIKAIVATHIILDYYDEKKLMNIKNDTTQLTTLYQASGLATRLQGFIKVFNAGGGQFYFGSAVRGAPYNSQFVGTITTQPYNISVLKVSAPIIPPGIDTQTPWPAPGAQTPLPPRKVGPPSPPPTSDEEAADSPDDAAAPDADAEEDAEVADAPSPSGSKKKKKGDAPSSAPSPAPGPAADDDAAADDEDTKDSSKPSSSSPGRLTRVGMGLAGASMGLAWLLIAAL
ncbi:fasciclin-like arabinogalactan protein 3 [Senna tora]|uniref:Fasciclin-like arabinogalactan protein 3 n=1 Tax=Senna tora TaxID=362788 RepID=A0A834WC82_9FABA|nr:fasciclin-like arabinogalactan protein 3 [Senna tora]